MVVFLFLKVKGNVPRSFAQSLVTKFGDQLRSSCPRECGASFLLKDRKEHADFCSAGIATCLRCGGKMKRAEMKEHHLKYCQSEFFFLCSLCSLVILCLVPFLY